MGGQKAGRRTVKNLVKEFKADRVRNANVILDIMERIESNDAGTTLSAVTGLHHIFTYLLHEQAIERPIKKDGEDSAKNVFRKWFLEMFEDTLKAFLQLLNHTERAVQELALSSLVKLMQSEGRHPIKKSSKGNYGFPLRRLKAVISVLVSDTVDHRPLIALLLEYMDYQDFLYYTLLAVSEVVKTHTKTHADMNVSVTYMNNLFPLLEKIKIAPQESCSLLAPPRLFLHPPEEDNPSKQEEEEDEQPPRFTIPYAEARHALNVIWPAVLQYPLTPELYRRTLVALPDLAMPHLDKPLALTGFFMESYNMGGAISLLALQGVFILINKHDLDYPDFYKKLYALLEPTIFHAKYRARFFMLCDRFLASTHLPEYLVASFIKRLARLSLHAPSSCLHLIIKFIVNLLIRFPGLQRLIHNPSVTEQDGDPFQPEEADPALSKAGQSSLWEIASLHHHFLPAVVRAAAFTHKHSLPQHEANLGDWVEQGYDELFERACKVTVKEGIATTFVRPDGFFQYPEDRMKSSWCLTPQGLSTGAWVSVAEESAV